MFIHNIRTQSIQVWHVCPVRMGRLILKLSSMPSLKTRKHKIADKPEKMKYKCVQIKWWDEALKCNVNMKNSFGFCGFFSLHFSCVCIYYMSTFHYLLVQATSIQFVIVLFGWRAKIKRYCYTKLCELLHTNVYIFFLLLELVLKVVLLQPLACFTRIFIPTENRIKSNEMEEK